MPTLTKPHKYILISGLLILTALVIFFMITFISGYQTTDEQIFLKEKQLAQYREIVREKNKLNNKLTALNQALEHYESMLLTGKTPALAAAEMQNILTRIADESKLDIPTMRVLDPVNIAKENYTRLPIQFTIGLTISQLKDILYKIDTAPKLLRVKNINIRYLGGPQDRQMIQATMTIEGFMEKVEDDRKHTTN